MHFRCPEQREDVLSQWSVCPYLAKACMRHREPASWRKSTVCFTVKSLFPLPLPALSCSICIQTVFVSSDYISNLAPRFLVGRCRSAEQQRPQVVLQSCALAPLARMEKPFSGSQVPYLQKEKLSLDFQKMLFQFTLLIFITAATPVKGHIDTSDP